MAVEVKIPTILRTYTGGEKAVSGSGETLQQLIDDVETRHPGLKARLVEKPHPTSWCVTPHLPTRSARPR